MKYVEATRMVLRFEVDALRKSVFDEKTDIIVSSANVVLCTVLVLCIFGLHLIKYSDKISVPVFFSVQHEAPTNAGSTATILGVGTGYDITPYKIAVGAEAVVVVAVDSTGSYGRLRGCVQSAEYVDEDVIIKILFPNGLWTEAGDKVEYSQMLVGNAEVLSEEYSLLSMIWYSVCLKSHKSIVR